LQNKLNISRHKLAVIHNEQDKATHQYFKPGDKIVVLYGLHRGQWGIITGKKPRYIRNQWLREVKLMGTQHKKNSVI
jgi:hypothetical protein